MSKRLRWGIIGTGNIARQFAAGVIDSSRRCELVAVGSRSRDRAASFAQAHAIATDHGSYEALLGNPQVDAIYLSLPNSMHHEWTLKSLAAGKHVLCEKPFAVNESQSREMFDAAERAGLVLIEAFMYRSHPQTQAVVETVRRGDIGKPQLIRTSFCYRTKRIDDNIRFRPDLAGGALMDVGCYCISFSRLIAGAEPQAMHAVAMMHQSGVDQNVVGMLQFPGGVLASFACGMNIQADNTAHICGDEAYIEIAWPWKPGPGKSGYTLARGIPPRQDQRPATPTPPPHEYISIDADRELYALEADDFAESALDGKPPRISRQETVGNMRVLDALRQQIGLPY